MYSLRTDWCCTCVRAAFPSVLRILSFADAAVDPVDFALAPEIAIRRALGFAGLETVSQSRHA